MQNVYQYAALKEYQLFPSQEKGFSAPAKMDRTKE
jgi:hypothetical protein